MTEKTASWLDSSALLALLRGEPGAEVVQDLLEAAERQKALVYFSAITLTELVSSIVRSHGGGTAREELQVVLEMPAQIAAPTREQCAEAGWLRGQHKLSTADAIIATQALAAGAELVHKDPEFEAVIGLKQRRLPYKRAARKR